MKKGKFKFLLCLSLMGALMLTGCAQTSDALQQSDNLADQALGQMIETEDDGNALGDKASPLYISTELPSDCPLTSKQMEEKILEYIQDVNKELKEGSICVKFGEEHTMYKTKTVAIEIENMDLLKVSNDPTEEATSRTVYFDTVEECFGFLYNRNQITALGERTAFSKGDNYKAPIPAPVVPDENQPTE